LLNKMSALSTTTSYVLTTMHNHTDCCAGSQTRPQTTTFVQQTHWANWLCVDRFIKTVNLPLKGVYSWLKMSSLLDGMTTEALPHNLHLTHTEWSVLLETSNTWIHNSRWGENK
jgi:hypothetical protein